LTIAALAVKEGALVLRIELMARRYQVIAYSFRTWTASPTSLDHWFQRREQIFDLQLHSAKPPL